MARRNSDGSQRISLGRGYAGKGFILAVLVAVGVSFKNSYDRQEFERARLEKAEAGIADWIKAEGYEESHIENRAQTQYGLTYTLKSDVRDLTYNVNYRYKFTSQYPKMLQERTINNSELEKLLDDNSSSLWKFSINKRSSECVKITCIISNPGNTNGFDSALYNVIKYLNDCYSSELLVNKSEAWGVMHPIVIDVTEEREDKYNIDEEVEHIEVNVTGTLSDKAMEDRITDTISALKRLSNYRNISKQISGTVFGYDFSELSRNDKTKIAAVISLINTDRLESIDTNLTTNQIRRYNMIGFNVEYLETRLVISKNKQGYVICDNKVYELPENFYEQYMKEIEFSISDWAKH